MRRIVIVLVVIAAGVAVTLGTTLLLPITPGFVSTLQAVASLALLGVTWVYTDATRRMATQQERHIQLIAQEGELGSTRTLFSWAFGEHLELVRLAAQLQTVCVDQMPDGSREKEMVALHSMSDEVVTRAQEIAAISVSLPPALRSDTVKTVTNIVHASALTVRALKLVRAEIASASRDEREVDLGRAASAWESPAEPDQRPETRWGDMASGAVFDFALQQIDDLRNKCIDHLDAARSSALA